ncbi:SPOSA6832_02524 [Sporobolomyces salmonicolor]|uniref:cysteine desulfurase n=1 Tax=Sporidiobolus salmonicolor TaxID=5005 RepID=A0A0D6EMB8_SPOSA|nr:SPOSA6832_02524 [Sporobolomyces salmonicolor]
MKRSVHQLCRLARPAAIPTARATPAAAALPLRRSLATVSSSVPLGNTTSLPIEVEATQTTVVTPSSDMMGFELSAGESAQATATTKQDLGRPIYLDAQATTPTDPRVLDAMLPYMTNQYGNPHSKTHAYGWETEKAVDEGRKHIADLIGADPKDIVFTSGATESNNMAIKGIARFYKGKKKHMQHHDPNRAQMRPRFVPHPPRRRLRLPINVDDLKVDVLSISAHKLYGPKGIGALYVRRKPRVRLEPIINGGGQERGLRSGTVAAPLVVGFGEAARIAKNEMAYDTAHIHRLAQRLYDGITKQCDQVVRNGDVDGYPGCTNLSFAAVEGESLLMSMKDIAVSSGSACTSASLEPSYVLRALGAEEDMAHSSIRFGIGRFTTEEEVDFVVDKVVSSVTRLRELSPLWEMMQEGIDLKSIDWSQH